MSDSEMEQVVRKWLEALHTNCPDTIGDLFRFDFVSCNVAKGEYTFLASTEPWMCNPNKTLHGGITATILDQGMGLTATCIKNGAYLTPSLQMNVTYNRPLVPGAQILLLVFVDTLTRTHLFMHAEAYSADQPERLCASASGVYYCIPVKKDAQ